MKFLNKILLSVLFAPMVMLTSCINSSDEPGGDDNPILLSAFATLTAKTETGMSFKTSEYLNSDTITYTTPLYSEFTGTVGNRYVLYFMRDNGTADNPFVSGPVSLYRINDPFRSDLVFASFEEIKEKLPVDAFCMYRHAAMGHLDVTFYAPISQRPKLFAAYVDEATADNEYPDMYICYEPDINNVQQTFFGTFNIQVMLDKPNCKGFNLHFRSNNGNVYMQRFYTDGSQPETPVQE